MSSDPIVQTAYNDQCCALAATVSLGHFLKSPTVDSQENLLKRTDIFPEWDGQPTPGAVGDDDGTFSRLGSLVGLKLRERRRISLGEKIQSDELRDYLAAILAQNQGALLVLHGEQTGGTWPSNHICTFIGVKGDTVTIMNAAQGQASYQPIKLLDFSKHTEIVIYSR